MKVQKAIIEDNKERFLLVDENGEPVMPVLKYLKSLDNKEVSPNTLRTYCYALKTYFEYLKQNDINFLEIGLEELSNYVGWLRNPYGNNKVKSMQEVESKRNERTINLYITVVTDFYDFLYRYEEINKDLTKKIFKNTYRGKKRYKEFLDHLNSDNTTKKNILKLKEPTRNISPLTNEEVKEIYNACNNTRDKFLIELLFETGLRIGEALSLYKEDVICDYCTGHKVVVKDRGNLENNARIKTKERTIAVSQEIINSYDNYMIEIVDDNNIDSDFLFVKIEGENKGKPLEYQNISSLFRRLKKKTGLDVHPHRLRHTHGTNYYLATKDIKALQERLGHEHITTTMNTYVHPSKEELRENWEEYNKALKDLKK